jgi:hypothetical protein
VVKHDLIGCARQINRDARHIMSGAGQRLRQRRPNIRIAK